MAKNLKQIKKEKKPQRWVWDGMIVEGSVNILVAQQSRGKSMLALGLVKEIIKSNRGQTYLSRGVRKQRVLYVSTEMDESTISSRLADLGADGRMRGIQSRFFVHYSPQPTLDEIREQINECNAEFIVIDILGGLIAGENYDMNDYQSFNDIVPKLRQMGKTFLLIHHMNKNKQALGSTGVLSAMDTRFEMLEVERKEDEDYTIVIYQSIHKYGKQVQDQYIDVEFKYPYFALSEESEEIEELDKPLSKLINEVILKRGEPLEGTYQEVAAQARMIEKYQFNPKSLGQLLRMNEDVLRSNDIHFEVTRKTNGYHLKIWYDPEEEESQD